ncbi:NADH dehydrogenase [ubiquinone] 1 alpha subcomplex subunit 6-like [Dreissena polymorpha]|uniref:NADH dehydrogenase [ubiquinone] 1 alpha subcomplex subunit 6 n=1 Tax=Dreissena polymorpha TaxID=45954 RepID=A0A9D4LQA8_DREPO|nr:NADH dehydrogenase [ubiquinone] 1 alpha subcomplex subunit 6-like [Dreissena polymorpha]KAH3862086.1 hypothetical protein DPMN_025047 [Dreissena polymorpha]
MAASKAVQGLKHAKPILSVDRNDARRRVLNLYKAWYRQIPVICNEYHINKRPKDLNRYLRQQFDKNRNVKDLRVIDILVIKSLQDLHETKNWWKMANHVLYPLQESVNPKPTGFLSKFLEGHDP